MISQVDITSGHGVIDAHLFRPKQAGAFPAVVMMTDVHGSRASYDAMGHRLAAAGYVVLVPNLYYRGGRAPLWDLTLSRDDDGVKAKREEMRGLLTPKAIVADMATHLDYLAGLSFVKGSKAGVVGYCMSGSFALRAAGAFPDRVGAAASFHGGRLATDTPDSPHACLPAVKGQLYFGHAEQDASMPAEMIERFVAALRASGVSFRSELYNARHGFAITDVPAYNPEACERHWRNLLELFGTALAA